MLNQSFQPVHLAFSDKYDSSHAEHYLRKHRAGLSRRLSHWRDVQMARQALRMAGNPREILDLPCGAGRFWPTLLENPECSLIAADNSPDMIAVARAAQAPELLPRVRTLRTSAFAIDLPAQAVDSVFCMRLLHHIGEHEHRLAMLREFHRVTRETLIVSLWVDGNFKAMRRKRLERRRPRHAEPNRLVIPARQIESEFAEAGFDIVGCSDFLPLYAMWRVYVLRKVARPSKIGAGEAS